MATGNTTKPANPSAAWTAAYDAAIARKNTPANAVVIANKTPAAKPGTGSVNRPTVGSGTSPTPSTGPDPSTTPDTSATDAELARLRAENDTLKKKQADDQATKDAANRNAYDQLTQLFSSYGLDTLSSQILKMVQDGDGSDTISLKLQQTAEWKARFPANDARLKAGLSVLTPAEYISTERAYRQVMQAAGLPVGFYDSNNDFTKFLSQDVSPTEVQQRVQAAGEAINNAPKSTQDYFSQFYSQGDLIAYALDPTVAEPLIEQRIKAAEAAALAAQNGFSVGQSTAEGLGRQNFTLAQLNQGMVNSGVDAANVSKLNSIYGQDVTSDDLVQSVFGTSADAVKKVNRLASQERAAFSGTAGATGAGLSSNAGGQF